MATWDDSKRQTNLARHGLDFVGCESVFDSPVLTREDTREAYGEQRLVLIGWPRQATQHEIEEFYKALSGS